MADGQGDLGPKELFDMHADVCKALANPKRLMIITLLSKGEMSVGQIVDALGLSLPNVSQHLRVLKSRHLVDMRKEGQTVYYRLTDRRLPDACTKIRSILLDNMEKHGRKAKEFSKK